MNVASAAPDEPDDPLAELFGRMLDSDDPLALLDGVTDPELKKAAQKLWRGHLLAQSLGFLEHTPSMQIQGVFSVGQILSGRFRVEKLLGSGGMGEVYLAHDLQLGMPIAIKTSSLLLAQVPNVRERLLLEVQNARRVTHPNVCRIYEYYEEPRSSAIYFSMELLDGPTLDECIASGSIEKANRRGWLLDLANGLKAAHEEGIVHGDFKPANVIVTSGASPRAVITDFGLARALNALAADADPRFSIRGKTEGFTAPEIVAGGPPSVAGDLYAFGRVAEILQPKSRWWKPYLHPTPTKRPATLQPAIAALNPDRRTRRTLLLAAVAGIGTAGYFARDRLSPATIPKGSTLLVNGIHTPERLLSLARSLRDAFVLGIQQCPRLQVLDDRRIFGEMSLLGAGGKLPAAGPTLLRLLENMRVAYWVESTLSEDAGRLNWQIALRRAADGFAVLERNFSRHGSILEIAETAAVWLRTSAGESDESLRVNPAGVGDFTSKVPEALDRYSEGIQLYYRGAMLDAKYPFQEAVRLDPQFAQAHAMLGMCHNLSRHVDLAVASLDRAMQLADKLPAREKSVIAANYYRIVEDPVGMLEEAEKNAAFRAQEPYFLRQLANNYCWVGSANKSIPVTRRAMELAPRQDMLVSELLVNLCEAGQFDTAWEELQLAEKAGRNPRLFDRGAGLVYLCREDYKAAQKTFDLDPQTPGRIAHGAKYLAGSRDLAIAGWAQSRAYSRSRGAVAEEHELAEYITGAQYLAGANTFALQELVSMPELPICPASARRFQAQMFWACRVGDLASFEAAERGLLAIERWWANPHTTGMVKFGAACRSRIDKRFEEADTAIQDSLGLTFAPLTFIESAEIAALNGRLDVAASRWKRFEDLKGTVLKLWFPGYLLYGWRQAMELAQRSSDQKLAATYAQNILRHWGTSDPKSSLTQDAMRLLMSQTVQPLRYSI